MTEYRKNPLLESPVIIKVMAESLEKSARENNPAETLLYSNVMSHAGTGHRVIDIGAGIGRYAIPMAKAGVNVIAVEPSAEMCRHLFEAVERENVKSKMEIIQSEWPVDRDLHADVAFASFVIQFSSDPVGFIHAMERSARNRCILSVHVDQPLALLKSIWPVFRPDEPVPSMIAFSDLYPMMLNDGIMADVTIIKEDQHPSPAMKPEKMTAMISDLLGIRDKPDEMQRLVNIINTKKEQMQQPHTVRSALISWSPDR